MPPSSSSCPGSGKPTRISIVDLNESTTNFGNVADHLQHKTL